MEAKKNEIFQGAQKSLISDIKQFLDEALVIKAKDKPELRKEVSRNYGKFKILAVQGSNDEVNRAAVEDKKVDILLNPEIERTYDFSDWRNSGLNDVLCKLASQNDVAIGIDVSILPEERFARAERIGRIMQNIRLCRKFKTKIFIFSGKNELNEHDLRSIALTLGASTQQADESLSFSKKK